MRGGGERPSEAPVGATAAASLTLQFALELGALAALAYAGVAAGGGTGTRVLLGAGLPLLAIAFWATFGSPRAPRNARGAGRIAVQAAFFGTAAAALALAGEPWLALASAVLVAANVALLRRLGHDG